MEEKYENDIIEEYILKDECERINDLEHYVETAGEGLIMNEYSDFISRDNYKFNPNGFTLKTIIIDNY